MLGQTPSAYLPDSVKSIQSNQKQELGCRLRTTGWAMLACIALVFVFTGCASREELVAVRGYRIVTPDKPTPAESYAATELQKYLADITGAPLPIMAEGRARGGRAFFIGKCRRVGKELQARVANLGSDGVLIQSVGKDYVLLGKDDRGQVYATYAFLERFCGCRFLARDCTITPRTPLLILPKIEYSYTPPFVYRDELYHDVSDWQFAARLKLNGANIWQCLGQPVPDTQGRFTGVLIWPFVHTAAALVPGNQYFATHPEYYSLVGGKRISDAISGQLCFTHPDVVEIAKAQALKWIEQSPRLTAVDISQNDAWPGRPGCCECDACVAVVKEEGAQHGTILRLVNAVADAVKARYPDKYVETIAYQYSIAAPKVTKPRDNVIIRLCHHACYFHGIGDEELSQPYRAAIDDWRKIARSIWVWHYGVNFWDYLAPNPNLNALVDDIRYYAAHGVNGVMLQGNLQGSGSELSDLRQYLTAQLLWDPTQDPMKLRAEFCTGYYGPAANDALEFLALMDAWGKEIKAHIPMNGWRPQEITPPEFVAKGLAILNRACDRTEDTAIRNRLEKLLVPLWHMQLSWPEQYGLRMEDAPALLARFRKALETNRITASSEGGPSAGLVAEYEKRYGAKPQ
ncbi:MAG TPA: DUF4838 domain-containing protein [Verrucomicrobiae bacterium]